MSIFRSRHPKATSKPRGNRRIFDSTDEKQPVESAPRSQRRKNRRKTEAQQTKSGNNRRVLRGDAPDREDVEPKNRRINRPVAEAPENSVALDDTANDGPPRERDLSRLKPLVIGFLRILAVLATIALVVWGARAAYRYALTSTYFALQHVEINGNERLSNGEVLGAAGIEMSQNIFSIKLQEVSKRLEATPWVVSAGVRQKLPKTIVIDIIERKPTMMVLFDVPYLVDESGEIFKRWSTDDPMPECLLSGLSRRDLAEDLESTQQIILDAISLRDRYNEAGNARFAKLYEIHREIDGGFSLTVGQKPFYIKIGKPPYRKKLNRMAQLFRKMGKGKRRPLIVYFDNEKRPDRVTIKFKPQNGK